MLTKFGTLILGQKMLPLECYLLDTADVSVEKKKKCLAKPQDDRQG